MPAQVAVLLTVAGMTTPTPPVTVPVLHGQLPLPFAATGAPDAAPHDDQERDTPVPVPGRAQVPGEPLEPAVAAVLGGLGVLPDALTRARAATVVLAELETARLAVVALRRTAVVATRLSARELAAELGLSVGAACDLRASARGRRRRPGR